MNVATIPVSSSAPPATVADLLERFKHVPPSRILLNPRPGTATEQDVIAAVEGKRCLCELVDGVLVEKPMSYYESRLSAVLIYFLEAFLEEHDLGIVLAPDAMVQMRPGRVRLPDVSFFSWDQFPDRLLPRGQILVRTPDLAVEVLSPSNTLGEMEQTRGEYFAGRARLGWQVYPDSRQVRIYTSLDQFEEIGEGAALTGGVVLPGFTLSVRRWFERAGRWEE